MEVSQMNKTAILSFIIDEVALKCRNVSTNMRKRIHWMLKYMEITVRKYDERALVLNGWVRQGKKEVEISEIEEMKKGLSNYRLRSQEQLDRMMSLNNEIRYFELCFRLTKPIEVESIEDLMIGQKNYDIYSKCSFNTAKQLTLHGLSTDQIKFILTRFKKVDTLKIYRSLIESANFTKSRVKRFHFRYVSIKEPIYLPRQIDELDLYYCESSKLIRVHKVNEICLENHSFTPNEYKNILRSLEGVKLASINGSLIRLFKYLPSTIRKLNITDPFQTESKSEAILKRFPNLIETNLPFRIEALDKSRLRAISPIMGEINEKFNLSPRKITISWSHASQFNNYPELFKKVESVVISNWKFNFDVLSSKIKRIYIEDGIDEDSLALNRLKKEQ